MWKSVIFPSPLFPIIKLSHFNYSRAQNASLFADRWLILNSPMTFSDLRFVLWALIAFPVGQRSSKSEIFNCAIMPWSNDSCVNCWCIVFVPFVMLNPVLRSCTIKYSNPRFQSVRQF
jgi:hypothetical protein